MAPAPGEAPSGGVPTSRDVLAAERAALRRMGRLHWIHWAVVSASLVITLGAWPFSKQQINQRIESRFLGTSSHLLELVTERMQKYEDALWSGVAAIESHGGDMDYDDWHSFAASLRIEEKYLGINGIGVIHHLNPGDVDAYLAKQQATRPGFMIYPEHDQREFLPITYIEPEESNAQAIGLDMAHEANRYAAANAARDTGEARITGPIVLVQDESRTPGFLFYPPFFNGGRYASRDQRRANFAGIVYAPFVMRKLMRGVLDKTKRQVRLTISDGATILYDENGGDEPGADPNPMFVRTAELDLYGRTWRFEMRTDLGFKALNSRNQPMVILLCGLTIDALLFVLFVMLTRSNRRALAFADRTNRALKAETRALERSNAQLEKFAYISSHDLKTPLRGLADLSDYIEEDLEPYLGSADANPDVRRNLDRIRDQVRRMDNLIKGVLAYPQVGGRAGAPVELDTGALFLRLADEHKLRAGQIVVDQGLPVLKTDALRFEQVAANLVGNAVQHHPDRNALVIHVGAAETGERWQFRIADNGAGIDPKSHRRIFEIFETTNGRGGAESTGIGLAIAKKAVEDFGGTIGLESQLGQGATFTFDWPRGPAVAETAWAAE